MDVYRQRIAEHVIPGKRLGRHVRRDPRDLAHPVELAPALRSVNHASAGLPLDQGEVGSCTANALVGALNTVPHWATGQPTLAEPDALQAYSLEEQALYGQPYPPEDNGGTGKDVCDAGRRLGWLSFYQHAADIRGALLALVARPVITGVNWYSSFDSPDSTGLVTITPDAYVRGGHEVVATEIRVPADVNVGNMLANLDRIVVGLWNSWGPGWGVGGRFYWTAATWHQLLSEGGDVTVPRTRHGWVAEPLSAGA
jgi:hypothetical protein